MAKLILFEQALIRTYDLDEKDRWEIGRKTMENNPDISLESSIASRNQGELINTDGIWFFVLKSMSNGVFYNDERLEKKRNLEPVLLDEGDIIRIDCVNPHEHDMRNVIMIYTENDISNKWKAYTIDDEENLVVEDKNICSKKELYNGYAFVINNRHYVYYRGFLYYNDK